MSIDIELGQSADVYFVLAAMGHIFTEFFIEPVNALDNDGLFPCHRQPLALVPLPVPRQKVISRQNDFLSCQQSQHMFIKELYIQRLNTLIIVISIGLARCIFPIDKIVVQRNGHRQKLGRPQLYPQALGKGSLPR